MHNIFSNNVYCRLNIATPNHQQCYKKTSLEARLGSFGAKAMMKMPLSSKSRLKLTLPNNQIYYMTYPPTRLNINNFRSLEARLSM